jgi:hypothetical protein
MPGLYVEPGSFWGDDLVAVSIDSQSIQADGTGFYSRAKVGPFCSVERLAFSGMLGTGCCS